MHLDEWKRTLIFCRLVLVVVAAGLASMVFVGGDPTAKIVLIVGASTAAAAIFWVLWVMRRPEEYTVGRIFAVAILLSVCVQTGIYFFGVFSPAPTLVLLGIFFYGKGANRLATGTAYAICAVVYAVGGGLMVAGVLRDPGLIAGAGLDTVEKITVLTLVEFLYLIAYLIAVGSRESQLEAITQLDEALRQVQVREALLAEARADLNRAMRIGDRGRHSGEVVGAYRLGVLLGRGGMGEVYEATHIETGGEAAVKLLSPAALASADQLERFLREIEAIAMLDAAEVVRLLAYGRFAEGAPYLVMEKLAGRDLASILRERQRLDGPAVTEMIREVGRGLAAAWELGIVHRDIKPQNLFRHEGEPPTWKVLDFGVSKLASTHGTLTAGHVVGTPGYMAPEQARGEDVDYMADVYALGVIAYRSLTGRPAFSGKDVPATMYEVVYGMPARPSDMADLDPDIDLALAVAIAKSPAERFGTPEELAGAIEAALAGRLPGPIRRRGARLLEVHPWREQ